VEDRHNVMCHVTELYFVRKTVPQWDSNANPLSASHCINDHWLTSAKQGTLQRKRRKWKNTVGKCQSATQ